MNRLTPALSESTPGYACLIGEGSTLLFEEYLGLADYERKIPITQNTVFRTASLSKQFTAMATMLLYEKGKLSFDDALNKYFNDYPSYGKQVTIRHMLAHTGGIPDHEKPLYQILKEGDEPTIHNVLEVLKMQKKPRFQPGTHYEHSDAGYVLLALIIEKISERKYGDFIRDYIFKPLGMENSIVLDERKPFIAERAYGYQFKNGWQLYDYDPLNYIVGDEGVYSTVRDLFQWRQAWFSPLLVSEKVLKYGFHTGILSDGSESECSFGWFVKKLKKITWLYHTGTWVGFNNIMINFVEPEVTVILLSNTTHFPTEKEKVDFAMEMLKRATY